MLVVCQVGAFKFQTTFDTFFLDNPSFEDKKETVWEQLTQDNGRAILTHMNHTINELEFVHFTRIDF